MLEQPEPIQQRRFTKEWATVLASVSWEWLYADNQLPSRNQTRIACKWCKEGSTISLRIMARAVTPMGHLAAGPYGTWVKLDNGFLRVPTIHHADGRRPAQQIREELSLSLQIQTRDTNFGIIHSRSVYSEQVPRVLPGPRDRRMTAGGSIEWERPVVSPHQARQTTTRRGKKPRSIPQNQSPTPRANTS